MLNMPPVGAALSIMEFNMCVCLLFSFVCLCVYSLMLLCTHLSEFLMNKDVYITDVCEVRTTDKMKISKTAQRKMQRITCG